MKKLSLLLVAILLITSLPGCNLAPNDGLTAAPFPPSDKGIMEDKKYVEYTIDDNFADDSINVMIQNAYSLVLHTYTPEDFPEIECIAVESLHPYRDEAVRKILNGEPVKDVYKDYDILKYKQGFTLTLKNPSKENVMKAVEKLEKRVDILYVAPNFRLEMF